MTFRWITALLAATLLLAACGGGSDEGDRTKAKLRLVNASAYAMLDLRVQDELRQSGVAYGESASTVEVDPSKAESKITRSGSATALISFTPAVERKKHYTVLAYGAEGALRQMLVDDNVGEPDSGRALLRVVNAAPDTGKLDIYLTGADEPLASAVPVQAGAEFGVANGLLTVDSTSWRLRVTAAGSKTDLRLDLPALALQSKQVATLVLTPARGGVLMNTLLLTQQGGIARQDTPQARVRVAAGLADSGAVSATVGSQVLMASVGSPAVGRYELLPAGTQPVALAVNGTSLPAPAVTLAAGADYTLLVRGTPAAPLSGWIEDDNHRAADSGQAKLRLVNGVADLAAPLSMTVDYVPAADGVLPGAASAYSSLDATPTAQLSVTAAGLAAPLFSADDQPLAAGAVYSVFVVGAPGAAVGILRKDH